MKGLRQHGFPALVGCGGLDVAIMVEHSERVAMLEDANKSIRDVRIRKNVASVFGRPIEGQATLLLTR